MRYQFKGLPGMWKIYNEKNVRVGRIRAGRARKWELEYGGQTQRYQYFRDKHTVWLLQDGKTCLTGIFLYHAEKSLFCPPMPAELKLQWSGQDWSLRQLPTRIIEIYSGGQKTGCLSGMTAGRKILEWSGGETNLEMGILCFVLGRYMLEDDTCWVV